MIDRLRAFIERGEGSFGSLALDLYRWQVAQNADYAAFCAGAEPTGWRRIPAVPVALFRDLALTCGPVEEARVVFRTSGTTGRRGVVRMRDTVLYDLGARLHARAVVGPIPRVAVSLAPTAADSSLGHMCEDLAPGGSRHCTPDGFVDAAGAWAALRAATEPVFVPGTAFAFADLVLRADAPVDLPAGSVVMVTGGFKGRSVALSSDALAARLRALLPGTPIVGEYGMSELSSQLWSPDLDAPFVPPPWLGVVTVDPRTGAPVDGLGLLKFVDLASAWTVAAIETRDLGEVLPDGRVVLRGRLEGDQPRGCSLTVEEAWLGPVRGKAAASPDRRTEAQKLADLALPSGVAEPAPALSAADGPRVDAVLRALARLRGVEVGPLSMGLHPENADQSLDAALSAITRGGLARELATRADRPGRVAIVVPWGVFTTPIEWVALYAAAGAGVHLKAPTRDPALCVALATVMQAEGLPVTASTDRALPDVDAVVAFGDDASVASVAAANPSARHALYGHRFSVAVVGDEPASAAALADAHLLYDTRGCMAPVAVFVVGDGGRLVEALAEALADAARAAPAGEPDPALGPEVRRRVGLARVTGRVVEGVDWTVAVLPAAHFTPVALPRFATVHPVPDAAALRDALAPWRGHLSTLGTDDLLRPRREGGAWLELYGWFPRVDTLGRMQRPPFPRRHDGQPMLGSVCGTR